MRADPKPFGTAYPIGIAFVRATAVTPGIVPSSCSSCLVYLRGLIRRRRDRCWNRDPDRLQLIGVESWLDAAERKERANHQPRAHEQHERQRHLRDDQCVTRLQALAAVAGAAAAREHPGESSSRVLERRNQSEQNPRQDRDKQGEREDAGINRDLLQARKRIGADRFQQRVRRRRR